MAVLDTETGKVIATLPIDEGVDGNGFDAGLAMSANGAGTLTLDVVRNRLAKAADEAHQRGFQAVGISRKPVALNPKPKTRPKCV
ncbi:MAG: hypothetical protein HQK97_07965 [Nitrospirae bacterium]|nr:hypothetical protein [Nitrospirota bacterium]